MLPATRSDPAVIVARRTVSLAERRASRAMLLIGAGTFTDGYEVRRRGRDGDPGCGAAMLAGARLASAGALLLLGSAAAAVVVNVASAP